MYTQRMDQPKLHETLADQLFTDGFLTAEQISQCGTLDQAGVLLAKMELYQRTELVDLANGRWGGDPDEVAGLRQLGLQDGELGVTPQGALLVAILDQSWDHPVRRKAGV